MQVFQLGGKPAIIAACCMQELHATVTHETTSLLTTKRNLYAIVVILKVHVLHWKAGINAPYSWEFTREMM